jgi:hypothetical protein
MSFLSKLWEFFTPKVIFVGASELSNPLYRKRWKKPQFYPEHVTILKELANLWTVTTRQFIQKSKVPYADKRLNEVFHLGYADAFKETKKGEKRYKYKINEEGLKLIK